jgi:hypothetical protein
LPEYLLPQRYCPKNTLTLLLSQEIKNFFKSSTKIIGLY